VLQRVPKTARELMACPTLTAHVGSGRNSRHKAG
jgi:hypothetical protein